MRQAVRGPKVDDVAARVNETLSSLDLGQKVRPGDRVAVTAGSRGIANVATAIAATVAHLRALGAEPFVVPAMGSHGGGTAEGQVELLESYGITEATCGCPIVASMDTVTLGESKLGFPMLFDRVASEADHVVLVNRVKTHTMFTGPVESGLAKMAMIGLGKQAGAAVYHQAIVEHGWTAVIDDVVPVVLEKGKVLAGVALVERGDEETARVEALHAEAILTDEPALLADSRRWMATLPFTDIDLLLVDEIGKNISGAGLDPSVVGRKDSLHMADPGRDLRVRFIAARNLSEDTHGNAIGVGIAEFCRSRLLRGMDVEATRLNAFTAGDIAPAMASLDFETDAEIVDIGALDDRAARPARGQSHLDAQHARGRRRRLFRSALRDEADLRDDIEVLTSPAPLPFDGEGNLPDFLPRVGLVAPSPACGHQRPHAAGW